MFVMETHVAPWTCWVGATCHGSEAGATANSTGGFVAGCEESSIQRASRRFVEP